MAPKRKFRDEPRCFSCGGHDELVDRKSADIICVDCGSVNGKWNPEHPDNANNMPLSYVRHNYFDVVVNNVLGYDCRKVKMTEIARIRAEAPTEREWDVTKVRSITRKLKLKNLTKSAGRIAHGLRFGIAAPYPRLHHVELECLQGMFAYVDTAFEAILTKGRKNLISYTFVIGKLLDVIGRLDDFKHLIVPIKTKSKLTYAEKVWKVVSERAPWNERMESQQRNFSCKEYMAHHHAPVMASSICNMSLLKRSSILKKLKSSASEKGAVGVASLLQSNAIN